MWKFVKAGYDGNCILFGVNIFDFEWSDTGKDIEVLDPAYQQKHMATVYNVEIKGKTMAFAAGEFSNCVYGFYVQDVDSGMSW